MPGYFIPVTILDNPPEDSRIVQEEQFGPVLPLLKFDDVDDVIAPRQRHRIRPRRLGLEQRRGLRARDRRADRKRHGLDQRDAAPLAARARSAGIKQSGLGVESGVEGLLEYTNPQTVVRRKQKA